MRAIVASIPLWGGMILVSVIATYFFAEGLKRRSDWALTVKQTFEQNNIKSIWFGPVVGLALALIGVGVVLPALGFAFDVVGVIVLVVLISLAFWLSKRASLATMRWRMADAVRS